MCILYCKHVFTQVISNSVHTPYHVLELLYFLCYIFLKKKRFKFIPVLSSVSDLVSSKFLNMKPSALGLWCIPMVKQSMRSQM